jgi:hypothetical protein
MAMQHLLKLQQHAVVMDTRQYAYLQALAANLKPIHVHYGLSCSIGVIIAHESKALALIGDPVHIHLCTAQ